MAKNKGLDLFRLPRWSQLPSVDQYLEQVLQLIDEWMGDFIPHTGKRVITRTMINNYVKQRFINPPENKKYNRLSIACLFVITVLKPVYTIDEISRLIRLGIDFKDAEFSYNQFCDMVEEAVRHAFDGTPLPKNPHRKDPKDLFWHVANSFASQLYVRHTYLL